MNIFMMMQAAGQAVADGAELAEGEEKVTIDLIELVMQGGWIMIPLFLLSFIAIYIFIERYLAIKRASREDKSFMNRIKDYIHEGKIESALALCESNDNPVSRMIAKGITRIGRPLNDVNIAIENVGNLEVSRLEKGLPVLATVAGGAPMIGFTGTVIGMIKSFWEMSNAGSNIEVDMLAGGIYTALVTTVTGLIVGIIAYFAYNWLVARVEKVVFKMEARTMEFMDLLNEPVR
ncbi:MotA/TolQ/ExbB proton channel family protein [Marinilabilia salmonicolor]|jgi:biopolymer transport protein ExbB|uniref:Outer membrane transport energization protein ExbB n=1 Tax=Marinilabilia salmonicolor TaxID=989 RepID=A0A2T0XP23_9BACT|nr:MotA/TolQ/ExbB proton channel family protein [Marinilabilia salmonicolor]PRZ00705.1 outer membrane transport energization protein ExbB [Marinilabilia salmonicolor]RCW27014.1 outer membrane transport energization protein ExbB [Marinilabilia salmonicolor]